MNNVDLTDWKLNEKDDINLDEVFGIKIGMDYFKMHGDFEQIRLNMWNVYCQNAQNHSSYLLTIILALLTVLAGVIGLTENILGIVVPSFMAAVILFGLCGWLRLRSEYWNIVSDLTITLPLRAIKILFNDFNRTHKCYIFSMPPPSAVLLYAVREHLIETQRKFVWRKYFVIKLALTTAGIRRPLYRKKE